ncbi:TPA: hypothetical protein JAD51_003611 [Proteus mirabilis]|nr:hypothetical protein [Proteus mirabilis]HAT5573829.1 hypothetical protein [Proteus mirabilis]
MGLLGGLNPYGYVHCPTGYIDPFGLECCLPNNFEKAKPYDVVNELKNFQGKDFHFGNETFKLDKSGMKHILERHHPEFWDGSIKNTQSFFNKDMSVNEITNAIESVMKQNRETLVTKGSIRMYQVEGQYNGVTYTLGLNNGRVGQFYPK